MAMTDVIRTPRLELRLVPLPALEALIDRDAERAGAAMGLTLPPHFLDHPGPWRFRRRQITEDPATAPWLVRLIVRRDDRAALGHAGLHGPPEDGFVEAGYTVFPAYRRRGYAREATAGLFTWAAGDERVERFRLSISPDNVASLGLAASMGFVQVGDQWDDEDGLELVLERPAAALVEIEVG
jgi:ribosomal-protein-alanine N-acetyltransferase